MLLTKSALLSVCLLCLAASLAAGDKDFWSTKSYDQWNAKEAEKLLRNSPWSKIARISSATGGRGSVITGSGGYSQGGEVARGSARGAATGGGAGGDEPLFVSWYSRPIREALARQTILENPQARPHDIQRILDYDATDHIDFVISGFSPRMLAATGSAGYEKLREDSYLQKKNKQRIIASAVLPGGRDQPLVIRFPRRGADGEVIQLEDREIDLVTRLAGTTVRVKFILAEMVVRGKPEF